MDIPEAAHVLSETNILLFLVQFLVLLGSAKLLGLLFVRLKQPTVTAEILVGVLLGPTIFGRAAPALQRALFPNDAFQNAMIDTIAWFGIFFLLLVAGLEVNFSSVWKQKGKALCISLSDTIIPIVISAMVLVFLPSRYLIDPERRWLFTLFLSTIMTISAMPVSIRVMQDMKLLRTDLGFLTISALSINDVLGWVLFTIILGIFSHGKPDVAFVFTIVVSTALFILVSATLFKWGIGRILTLVRKRCVDAPGYSLTVIALLGLACGAIAQAIGIHALFGFFLAGLVAAEAHELSEKTRSIISQVVHAVFVPIFFTTIALRIDVLRSFDISLVLLFTVVGIVARFIGAYVGVMLARSPRVHRWPVAALHTPGGEMHIVIGALALELQLINHVVFVAIITAAVLSSITLGPWLALILKRIMPKDTVQIAHRGALDLSATEKFTALDELCRVAAGMSARSFEEVYEAACNRERGMSTGVERGIAMPHARLPGLNEATVVCGRSTAGIDWNSPDGIPAHLIFLILTSEDRPELQLRIYSQVLRVLARADDLASIIEAPSAAMAVEMLNEHLRVASLNP